jgi:predicted small secreted protein
MKHTKTPSWIVGLLGRVLAFVARLTAVVSATCVAGCNTLNGIGDDLNSVGRATSDAFSSDDESRSENRRPTWP